jgi:hypothetical protein
MNKRLLLLGALCAAILITACIDSTTVISVRKDGSGTLTEIVYLNESVKTMMKDMMGLMGEETKDGDLLDSEKYKAKAANMGAGVKFVSVKEVTGKDGSAGVQVVYSFEDVRKLNIDAKPDNPMGDSMAGMMGAESAESGQDENPITFDFIKGVPSKLIVKMPKKSEPEKPEQDAEETIEGADASAGGMEMMKQFFEGFRIRVMVKLLEGKITKTNASFVDGKDTVILYDMALGEILGNEKYRKEMESMSQIRDMNVAMKKMQNIPGLKIET